MNEKQLPIPEPQSPWVRLQNLLDLRHTEIIDREQANEKYIHLYGTGGYWVAFEQSACQLCRLFPSCNTSIIRLVNYPFPIIMASVTDGELRAYARRHILRVADPEYWMLTTERLSFERYREWHRVEVAELT